MFSFNKFLSESFFTFASVQLIRNCKFCLLVEIMAFLLKMFAMIIASACNILYSNFIKLCFVFKSFKNVISCSLLPVHKKNILSVNLK